ncbi:MAG: sulfatase-like hydrolase/transferase [Rhodocyclaceae bacterium]|nr:sulfatase-like hydrolase/transferase [Rhodocyclaceae bacterium]
MRHALKFSGYLAGTLLFAIPLWIQSEFGEVSVDQVLYHLGFGSSALFASDPALTWRFIWRMLLPALGVAILLLLCDALVTAVARMGARQALLAWGNRLRQLAAHLADPAERALGACHTLIRYRFYLLIPALGSAYFIHAMGIADYVGSYLGPDHFATAYVDPKGVRIRGEKPRSLVMIYVESLENTYADPARFGRDLLARLNRLKPHGVSFDNYREKRGAHFTIAGIVATQCGVPLRSLGMFGGNDQGEQASRFLPRARCLGDILHDRGYTNVFLNGSSLAFAGVGKFFEDHHYDRIMGREEWLALGARAEDMSGWGLHDDDLFARAREELDRLVARKRPFNLSVLTIDTHHPYGLLSHRCSGKGVSDFEGIVECSANQVAEFVEHIIERGLLDQVAIVIQGDHLAMGNTAYEKLIAEPNRTVFNLLINGDRRLAKNTEDVTHFDMLPTVLDLIGLEVDGDRLGIGYSAIGRPAAPRPSDRLARLDDVLFNRSDAYLRLWEPEPAVMPARHMAPPGVTGEQATAFDKDAGAG